MNLRILNFLGFKGRQIQGKILESITVESTFSVKGQMINRLGFVGHAVFVTTIQFSHCNVKVTTDNI